MRHIADVKVHILVFSVANHLLVENHCRNVWFIVYELLFFFNDENDIFLWKKAWIALAATNDVSLYKRLVYKRGHQNLVAYEPPGTIQFEQPQIFVTHRAASMCRYTDTSPPIVCTTSSEQQPEHNTRRDLLRERNSFQTYAHIRC